MNDLTDIQKAYLAGLIDGEGCITISRFRKSPKHAYCYQLLTVVNMTSEDMIGWCHETTGVGHIHHYGLSSTTHNKQDEWHWRVGQKDTIDLLNQLVPFLILKRPQAKAALEFAEIKGRAKNRNIPVSPGLEEIRERYYLALREMKKSPCGRKCKNAKEV